MSRSFAKLFSVLFLLGIATVARAQTVTTDKSDYGPGETATIYGAGFHADEDVLVHVVHTDGNNGGNGHEAWIAHTDEGGSFVTTWYVDPDDSANATFNLTADCAHGLHASWTFTDSVYKLFFENPTKASPVTLSSVPNILNVTFKYRADASPEADVFVMGIAGAIISNVPLVDDAVNFHEATVPVPIPAAALNGIYDLQLYIRTGTAGVPPQQNARNIERTAFKLLTPPTINTNPLAATKCVGDSVTFTVNATSHGGPLTYQWRKDNSPIMGATGSSLTLTPLSFLDQGTYDVVVTSDASTDLEVSSTSTGALLKVFDFTVSVSPSTVIVAQNQVASYALKAVITPGSTGEPDVETFNFTPGAAPAGMTASVKKVNIYVAGGPTHYMTFSPTGPLMPVGTYGVSVSGAPASDPECVRVGNGTLQVLPALISSELRDLSNNVLTGLEAFFYEPTVPGGTRRMSGASPNTIRHFTKVTNTAAVPAGMRIELDLPGDSFTPAGTAAWWLYGGGSSANEAPPVRVVNADPTLSTISWATANDITPKDLQIGTDDRGVMYQGWQRDFTPRNTNFITSVTSSGSARTPVITVPSNGSIWLQSTLRYYHTGTYNWPNNSPGNFFQTYAIHANLSVDGVGLTNPSVASTSVAGNLVTAIGGAAVDTNGTPKNGLEIWVNGVFKCLTENGTGAYLVKLSAGNLSGTVVLKNADGDILGSKAYSVLANQYKQVDFLGLDPADPHIEGIVSDNGSTVAGAYVELFKGSKLLRTGRSNGGGYYAFRFAKPGAYTVRVTLPSGSVSSYSILVKDLESVPIDFVKKGGGFKGRSDR